MVRSWNTVVQNADELLKTGYSTISFDAPAHGKSPENTIMVDFIATILEIENNLDLSMLQLDIGWNVSIKSR
jgi:hypothetical protein